MSQPSVIYWPPSTGAGFQDAIAKSQVLVPMDSDVPLQANIPGVPNAYKFNKVIRGIDITSTDDLRAVHFIISGIGTPVDADKNPTGILRPITEDLQGLDGTTGNIAKSVNIYSQINSITVTRADATNFSIGFGEFGITDYVFMDYNRTTASLSAASVQFINNATMTAAVYISLNKPETPNIAQGGVLEPFGLETLPTVTFIPAFSIIGPGANTNTPAGFTSTFSVIWATILDTSTDSLYFTFIQPGIS